MLPPALTRYHLALIAALLVGGLAWWLRNGLLFGLVILALLALIALGVAIPRMSFFFAEHVILVPHFQRVWFLVPDPSPDATRRSAPPAKWCTWHCIFIQRKGRPNRNLTTISGVSSRGY